jgi:parvulin-like peptidyl-prolyl isomerase
MKKSLSLIVIAAFLVAASTGCAKKPSNDNKILARMSNKTITLGDFRKRVEKLPSYYRDMIDTNKKRFLDETIVEMMFYEEAIRQGLDSEKEVKEILKEAKKKILIAKLIQNEVESKVKVDDAEARKYYETHKAEFKAPELWRASHILVPTEEEAKSIADSISRGASFESLAREKSMDATASRGGDIGYFRKGQLVPEFETAALSLKPGELSPMVHSQFGYHVIKLTGKKDSDIEPYEKVKAKIVEELKKSKRSELFDQLVLSLKNKYKVEIEDDVFRTLDLMDKQKEGPSK